MSDWERRVAHYKKRKEQVAWLVDQLAAPLSVWLGSRIAGRIRRAPEHVE